MSVRLLLLDVALVCAIVSLLVASGALAAGSSTWPEWVSGSLSAYLGALVVGEYPRP